MNARMLIIAIFPALLAVVAGASLLRAHLSHVPPMAADAAAAVHAIDLPMREYKLTQSFFGLLKPQSQVDMAFQISGRIQSLGSDVDIRLRENDAVSAGDVLGRLASARYEAAVSQAEANVQQARASLAQAEAMLLDVQARLEDAEIEVDRLHALRQSYASTQRELERAELQKRLAEVQLQNQRAQIDSAYAAYEAARAERLVAAVNLEDATLYAPFDGVIAQMPAELGQMVQPGQKIMRIADMASMKLVVGVVERKLALLEAGQQVRVEIQALANSSSELGSVRQGTVTVVPPAADDVTGLFNVEIMLLNDDRQLRAGMVAKACVYIGERAAAAIPIHAAAPLGRQISAFFTQQDSSGQYFARRVILEPLAVENGYYLIDHTALPDGLLIVDGQQRLEDGQIVSVIDRPHLDAHEVLATVR